MKRTYIKDLSKYINEEVKIYGFIQAIRNQGKIAFLILRDVTGIIQCVVIKSENESMFELINTLSLESIVSIVGMVKEEKQAPSGYEISVLNIELISVADPGMPIPVVVEKGGEETDMTKRFDWRFIDLRKQEKLEIFKVSTTLERGFRRYFAQNNFVQIYSPTFMNTASETGAEVFEVSYFDKKAYLAQSPQFYKQMAMASGMEKVFSFGPVYRAEPSFTTRHTTEYTSVDFEISYIDSYQDVISALEELILFGFEEVKTHDLPELEIPKTPFPQITMKEAKGLLKKLNISSPKEHDVSPEEERALGSYFKEKHNSDFVFLTEYPIEARPFYHMKKDNIVTNSFDLLYKGVEIVTGAQREHRYELLNEQAREKNMDLELLEDYLNFFKYGCPPHGGVGLGLGRTVMGILELSSVKEASFLPRDVKRLTP